MPEPMIYQLIPKAMADMDAVGKNQFNQQQKFKFRGIDDVMNAMNPVLVKHQIFTVPEVLEQTREYRTTGSGAQLNYSLLKMRFSFFAPDGSHVDAITLGEGMDSGDKASNKAMAIAYKYALFQVFCIPTEEMPDPDAETPPPSKQETKKPDQEAERNAVVSKSAQVPAANAMPAPAAKIDRRQAFNDLCQTYGVKDADILATINTAVRDGYLDVINGDIGTMTDKDFARCMAECERRFRAALS